MVDISAVKPSTVFVFDKNTVVYLVYLLYKANMVTRYDIKKILKTIESPHPEDVLKYLVEEVNKL